MIRHAMTRAEMDMGRRVQGKGLLCAGCVLALGTGLVLSAPAANEPAAAGTNQPAHAEVSKPVVVLDTAGFWRTFIVFRPPVVRSTNGALEALTLSQPGSQTVPGYQWLNHKTPLPPADWLKPEFDDAIWTRLPGELFYATNGVVHPGTKDECPTFAQGITLNHSPWVAALFLRGKFTVTDVAQAGELRFSLSYWGGAAVYLNGIEIARGHLPKGPLEDIAYDAGDGKASARWLSRLGNSELALADDYDDALPLRPYHYDHSPAERPAGESHTRRLEITLPTSALRQGVNVLAIRLQRAPYRRKEMEYGVWGPGMNTLLWWASCALLDVRLDSIRPGDQAGGTPGVVPNMTRPKGVQVWNSNLLLPDCTLDYGDPNESLRPVLIVGARNGVFSGKVLVGSDGPLRGLGATISELRGTNAVIPAAAIRLCYALPGERAPGDRWRWKEVEGLARLDRLTEKCPAEIPPVTSTNVSLPAAVSGVPPPFGAVAAIWITVRVPEDARPGEYRGTLTVRAEGLAPTEVPVVLRVSGWRVPAPNDFTTFVSVMQSPESVALRYKAPLWSDRHFELVGKSFRLLSQIGARVIHLPLVARSNMGNAQALLRWVEQADGTRRPDVSILEKYLDCALANGMDPEVVVLYVTDVSRYDGHGDFDKPRIKRDPGVPATGVGRDGKIDEDFLLPRYGDPASKALWAAALEAVWPVLKARGLDKKAVFGKRSDADIMVSAAELFKELAPEAGWASLAHNPQPNGVRGMKIKYGAICYSIQNPEISKRHYGWQRGANDLLLLRSFDHEMPMPTWRALAEMCVAGDRRGFARLSADFWPVFPDRQGRLAYSISGRYPESDWQQLNINAAILAPGDEGAEGTARFEILREGLQEAEARIFIERTLLDEAKRAAIGADLAGRAQAILDERIAPMRMGVGTMVLSRSMWTSVMSDWSWIVCSAVKVSGSCWFAGSGWEARTEKLFDVASEIAGKLGVP